MEQTVFVFQAIAAVFAGFGGIVPLVNVIKRALNTPPRWSQFILVAVIVVYVIATGVIQGVLVPDSFTFQQAATTMAIILTASQAEYARIKRDNGR